MPCDFLHFVAQGWWCQSERCTCSLAVVTWQASSPYYYSLPPATMTCKYLNNGATRKVQSKLWQTPTAAAIITIRYTYESLTTRNNWRVVTSGCLSPRNGASSRRGCRNGINIEGGPPAWGLGDVLTSADRKKTNYVTNHSQITLNVNR